MSDLPITTSQLPLRQAVTELQPSAIRAFSAAVADIPGIIDLTVGEPDFNTPDAIKAAAVTSLEQNHTHYPPTPGTAELRQAIAAYLNEKYDLNYTADQTLATAGATESLWVSLYTITNPGDEIIIPTPAWPMYMSMVKAAGAVPVLVDTSSNHFVLSPELIEQTLADHPNAKAIMLNFPSNPTGVTYTRDEVIALANVLKQHAIYVISDEIYAELTYHGRHTSLAELLPDQTILINGLSKSHAMTGWRFGMIAAPKFLAPSLIKVHQFTITSVPYIVQDAALAALTVGKNEAEPMLAEYKQRGALVHERMQAMGFEALAPQGAFYYFAKVPAWLKQTPSEFALALAHEQAVAVIAAESFGPGAEQYFRISYATSLDKLQLAMARIEQYLADHRG